MNVAIRADGGHNIGMGHIMRCIALAEALLENGCRIYFITRPDHVVETVLRKRLYDDVSIVAIKDHNDITGELEQLEDIVRRHTIDALVVDSYEANRAYLIEAKKMVAKLISIDDLNRFAFPSDIVINSNIYAPQMEYKSLYRNTKFLLGPRYLLMRKEFRNLPKRCVKDRVERILVTMGGSDIMGLTAKVLRALQYIDDNITIDVVMGIAAKNRNGIESSAAKMPNVFLRSNVDNMAALMLKADLAISAAGSTLYELAACGVPTIALIQADNQVAVAVGMDKAGCIVNLGWGDKVDDIRLFQIIYDLIDNTILRHNMIRMGQQLFDGYGALRCAENIYNAISL